MLKAAVVAIALITLSCTLLYTAPTVAQGAINQAIELQLAQKRLEERLKKYREELRIGFVFISREEFLSFLDRIEKNQELKDAILKAKNSGILTVAGRSSFVASSNTISLDIRDDDEAIISFLLGR